MKFHLDGPRKKVLPRVAMSIALLLAAKSIFNFQTPPVLGPVEPAKTADLANLQGPTIKMKRDTWRDPTLDFDRLRLTENWVYQGTRRDIFRAEIVVSRREIPDPPEPAPPISSDEIVASAMQLRFFGFASIPNQPRKAFLGEDDSLFVATEGEIVNRRYRVLKIGSNSVIVEDLIEKCVHRLPFPS